MASQYQIDRQFMEAAISLAHEAERLGEVPVGSVVVMEGQVIGQGYNRVICDKDPSAHAEVVALRHAAETIDNHRLIGASLYVTLEPCIMCAGALLNGRVERLIFAARDQRFGAAGSQLNLLESRFLNHQCSVTAGVLESQSKRILQNFFAKKRL